MNIPSYNTEQDNSNKISTKRIPKWILPAIAVLIIIGIAVGGPLTDEDREWVGGQIQVGG